MYIHDWPEDRRRGDLLILQGFVVTMAGFWLTLFLLFMAILPIGGPGVWPLLDVAESASGEKAPDREGDLFVSVDRRGRVYVDERAVATAELRSALQAVGRDNIIYLRVDHAAPFGAVRAVVREAQSAGVRRVTLLVKPRRQHAHDLGLGAEVRSLGLGPRPGRAGDRLFPARTLSDEGLPPLVSRGAGARAHHPAQLRRDDHLRRGLPRAAALDGRGGAAAEADPRAFLAERRRSSGRLPQRDDRV